MNTLFDRAKNTVVRQLKTTYNLSATLVDLATAFDAEAKGNQMAGSDSVTISSDGVYPAGTELEIGGISYTVTDRVRVTTVGTEVKISPPLQAEVNDGDPVTLVADQVETPITVREVSSDSARKTFGDGVLQDTDEVFAVMRDDSITPGITLNVQGRSYSIGSTRRRGLEVLLKCQA